MMKLRLDSPAKTAGAGRAHWRHRLALQTSCRFIPMLVALVSVAWGCASYLEATRPEYKDASVIRVGAQRADIIAQLGSPAQTYKDGDKDVDVFKIDPNGRRPETKQVVGALNGTADALTLGLWEAVATPAELATRHSLTDYIVTYKQDDTVESFHTGEAQ